MEETFFYELGRNCLNCELYITQWVRISDHTKSLSSYKIYIANITLNNSCLFYNVYGLLLNV